MSRRILERARAKLARLGLIERVTWMNTRFGGLQGWRLSARMSTALRAMADRIDLLRQDRGPARTKKEEALVELLRPANESHMLPSRLAARVSKTGRETATLKNSG